LYLQGFSLFQLRKQDDKSKGLNFLNMNWY